MHELFLTAVVLDEDASQARAVLQGFCMTRERHYFTHVVYYQPQGLGLPAVKTTVKNGLPQNAKLWAELHQILSKQAYLVQNRFELGEKALRDGTELVHVAAKIGTFRWNDAAEPTGNRPVVHVQRKMLEIKDKNLERTLLENKLIKKSQAIEESYKWWRDGVEFSLVRILALPPTLLSPDSAQTFPLLADLPAVAPMWMLYARVVAPESTPAQVGQCIEQLNDIHAKLFGVFDFKLFDRRVHDTRFAPQQAGAVRA